MSSQSHLAASRDVYAVLKETAESILAKAVLDSAGLHAAGGTWKLAARRMAFDYERIHLSVEGMKQAVVHGIERGELKPPHSVGLLQTFAALLKTIRSLVGEAERAAERATDLSLFKPGDAEGLQVLGDLLDQELDGDAAIKGRLEEVMEDDFPALYQPEEFIVMLAFYEEQDAVLKQLASEARRLRCGKGISAPDKAKLDRLKRNVAWIQKRADRALGWYV